jgi:uncharacterized protein
MFYRRDLEKTLQRFSKFQVIAIIGPRQSGKTTLARNVFNKHVFLNLELLDLRTMANENPQGFLRMYENEHGIIIDEFQYAPQLLSYIQVIVDEKKRPGYFILSGSQNFLVNQAITQSLAGRVGILTLLPFSLHELEESNLLPEFPEDAMFKGAYPRIYDENFDPNELYPSYIHSYLERDVRQLVNVGNFVAFERFIKLCAARVGQLVNFTEIAAQCGVSAPTIQQWVSILEASYIIFLLRPHWANFNKRIIKAPKLYFYDTGLACSLLEIRSKKELIKSNFYGSLFECFIIADLYKQYCNEGLPAPLYFWRDKNGTLEVDCLIDVAGNLIPVEIKSSETYNKHFFDGIATWCTLSTQASCKGYVIYGGSLEHENAQGTLVNWRGTANLITKIKTR